MALSGTHLRSVIALLSATNEEFNVSVAITGFILSVCTCLMRNMTSCASQMWHCVASVP